MTDIRHDYPEYHDQRQQQDDQRELQERLECILRNARHNPLTDEDVRWLCIGCGIDVRSVT